MEFTLQNSKATIKIPSTFGNYRFLDILGSGSFSVCCLAENIKTKEHIAAKIISRTLIKEQGLLAQIEQELRILETVHHPGLCNVYQIIYLEEIIIVCMEYGARGTLYEYLVANGPFHHLDSLNMFQALVETIAFLHTRGIAHRDIKLDNIVLTNDLKPKLIDFGVSTAYKGVQPSEAHVHNLRTTVCGTFEYMAPEILRGEVYNPYAADIWALGVTLYCMTVGNFPFSGTAKQIVNQVLNGAYSIPATIHPSIQKIIHACLNYDPSTRINASGLLKLVITSSALRLPKLIIPPQQSQRKLSHLQQISAFWNSKKMMPVPVRVHKSGRI